jgi:hypothetical protein
VAWDPLKFDLSTYLICGGIYLIGIHLEKRQQISFLTIYGPCGDRRSIWTNVVDNGILAHKNLIVVGDFNLTMSVREIWGVSSQPDPLPDLFKVLFMDTRLVDILPDALAPTWSNGREGSDRISKRLDRAFILAELLKATGRHRSWVANPFLSDHAPVILQLDHSSHTPTYTFNLNMAWLMDLELSRIVHEMWKDPSFLAKTEAQKRLVAKLKLIKQRIKKWAQLQRVNFFLILDKLEDDILRFYQLNSRGQMSRELITTLDVPGNDYEFSLKQFWKVNRYIGCLWKKF